MNSFIKKKRLVYPSDHGKQADETFPSKGIKEFYTHDLMLSSYFKYKGLRYLGVKKDNNRYLFIFEDAPQRASLIEDYYGSGTVKIADYRNCVAELKSSLMGV